MSGRRRRSTIRELLLWIPLFGLMLAAIVWLDGQNTAAFVGKARAVDGDSLIMNGERLRLYGIDAPERGQNCWRSGKEWPCGSRAHAQLRRLVRGKQVECSPNGIDRYDRWLVICTVKGPGKAVEINQTLVKQGWAINYGGYGEEERIAIKGRAGVWSGDFDRPQDWRRQNSDLRGDNGWYEPVGQRVRAFWKKYGG